MSIRFDLVSFQLGRILPYGWPRFIGAFGGKIMGHEFTMVASFRVVSYWRVGSKAVQPLPRLRWAEKEYWWELRADGEWEYKGENDKGDLYQGRPNSPTWGGFAQGKTEAYQGIWLSEPGFPVSRRLRPQLLTDSQQAQVQMAEADLERVRQRPAFKALYGDGYGSNREQNQIWFMFAEEMAARGRVLPCAALDRPGIAISGGSGVSGGGFVSKTTSESRRRVLTFDITVEGSGERFTATQILETHKAQPSISKFITSSLPREWAMNIPNDYLAYWRSRLNPLNIEDQTYTLESPETIEAWLTWSRRIGSSVGAHSKYVTPPSS